MIFNRRKNKTVLDSDANIITITVKKAEQPFGLVQLFDENNKVVFINNIVIETTAPYFNVGYQLLQMNGEKLSSKQHLIEIMRQTEPGEDLDFVLKKTKRSRSNNQANLAIKQHCKQPWEGPKESLIHAVD